MSLNKKYQKFVTTVKLTWLNINIANTNTTKMMAAKELINRIKLGQIMKNYFKFESN